jgi:hypothetical protein
MTSFEAGFIKQAEELGWPEAQASQLYKRASEYPGAEHLFKEMPAHGEAEGDTPEELDALSNLLKQELIDKNFSGATRHVQM